MSPISNISCQTRALRSWSRHYSTSRRRSPATLSTWPKQIRKALQPLFYAQSKSHRLAAAQQQDPLLSFGQNSYDAVLSPVGMIHLFRQYFFEFDSFLGPPVGHVWLSPGGTVELIEVSTRRTLTERAYEQAVETPVRVEPRRRRAGARRRRGEAGSSVRNSGSPPPPPTMRPSGLQAQVRIFRSRIASRPRAKQPTSRCESRARTFRAKSSAISKTTFKTSTELSDTASKRYVISNDTHRLVNYELRRKMRQVGVQVRKDIGVALCWQTFVDDAGRELGISKLVHIGKPPELGDLAQPDAPVVPTAQPQELNITIPFVGIDTDDTDNEYTDGAETVDSGWLDDVEHIEPNFPQNVLFTTPGYTLAKVDLEPQGFDARLSVRDMVARRAPALRLSPFTSIM